MSRRSDLTERKQAAEESIRTNAAALAAITGAAAVELPDDTAHRDATAEEVAQLELLAQCVAATVELATP